MTTITGTLIFTEMENIREELKNHLATIQHAESEMLKQIANDLLKRDERIMRDLEKQVYRNVETNERSTGGKLFDDYLYTNNLVNELGSAIDEYEAQLDEPYPVKNEKVEKELNERFNVNHRILENMRNATFEKVYRR